VVFVVIFRGQRNKEESLRKGKVTQHVDEEEDDTDSHAFFDHAG